MAFHRFHKDATGHRDTLPPAVHVKQSKVNNHQATLPVKTAVIPVVMPDFSGYLF